MTDAEKVLPRAIGDPSTHITVRIDPVAGLADTESEFIWAALVRLRVSADRRVDLWNRSDDFIDRVRYAGLNAGFRPAPSGERSKPSEIIVAIDSISTGLERIGRGLSVIDGARQSTSPSAAARDAELARLQRAILGTIIDAVSRGLPGMSIPADAFNAAMPTYGTNYFANSWNGVFSLAAHKVAAFGAGASNVDMRTPKARDGWTEILIATLGEIYRDVTGRRPSAYGRGSDSTNPAWRAPFCQFVADLWPLWFGPDDLPSDITIARALKKGQDAIR